MAKKKVNKKKGKREKNGFFKNRYIEVWNYLKESKNYIWFALFLFLFFSVFGFLFPIFYVNEIEEFIKQLIEMTEGLNVWQMIRFIFANNVWSSFSGILFGVVLGIIPILSAIINGYVLGFVSNVVVGEVGYLSLWRLLPHGIFEIPAVIISLGLGIKLGMFVFAKNKLKEFKRRFIMAMRVFFFVVLPLLVIAAIIEGALIILLS